MVVRGKAHASERTSCRNSKGGKHTESARLVRFATLPLDARVSVQLIRAFRPRFDHDDDPVVDVNIIYDGKYEQLNPAGLLRVRSEVVTKTWRQVEEDVGFPLAHFIAKSDIGRRDPATI